jgi:hypothetical protein
MGFRTVCTMGIATCAMGATMVMTIAKADALAPG